MMILPFLVVAKEDTEEVFSRFQVVLEEGAHEVEEALVVSEAVEVLAEAALREAGRWINFIFVQYFAFDDEPRYAHRVFENHRYGKS